MVQSHEALLEASSESELKVYLAARYSRKDEIKQKAEELAALGINVTSRWLKEPPSENGLGNEKSGIQDLEDIDNSDLLILFTENPEEAFRRGGRHFESGYAYAKNISIIIIGPVENTFHHSKRIVKVASWEDLKTNLKFLLQVKHI